MENRNGAAPSVRSVVELFSPHERKSYSIVRAILRSADVAEGRGPGLEAGSIEMEISNAISSVIGAPTREIGALRIPLVDMEERSGLVTSSNSAGGYTVQGTIGELIPLLRSRTLALKLGAQLLPAIQGSALLPLQSTGSTGAWVGENPGADQTDSDAAFGQKSLTPKMYCVTTSYSRRFLQISSIAAEEFVRADLMAQLGVALDAAILNGSGASNQPTGILQTAGVDTSVVGGTNGGQLTLANVLAMQQAVAVANADDNLAIVTTPAVRARAKQTLRATGAATFLWDDNDRVAGIPAYCTTSLPTNLVKGTSNNCSPLILGAFNTIAVGLWGGSAEIVVDPFRLKKQGMLEVTLYASADVCLRLPQAFSVMKDLLP
jgi:HK97 family phage major capsid protein